MSHQQHSFEDNVASDAGRHLARLRHVLGLVEQIAGRASASAEDALDENARISSAYEAAPPIAQRRFDTLVAEASCWASSGVDALASAKDPRSQPRIAAARLADELDHSIRQMRKVLGL
ncbi:MAG TPA: hypothetical protein VGD10_07455 [Allosphingosinicella sp.]|uniref:hypothetical protein n=1 Tax=Allosphingosinicella sp. TaxID=2823234 RepID=UPI002ED9D7DF